MYLRIEKAWLKYCKEVQIDMESMDLLFWSMETGFILKYTRVGDDKSNFHRLHIVVSLINYLHEKHFTALPIGLLV